MMEYYEDEDETQDAPDFQLSELESWHSAVRVYEKYPELIERGFPAASLYNMRVDFDQRVLKIGFSLLPLNDDASGRRKCGVAHIREDAPRGPLVWLSDDLERADKNLVIDLAGDSHKVTDHREAGEQGYLTEIQFDKTRMLEVLQDDFYFSLNPIDWLFEECDGAPI